MSQAHETYFAFVSLFQFGAFVLLAYVAIKFHSAVKHTQATSQDSWVTTLRPRLSKTRLFIVLFILLGAAFTSLFSLPRLLSILSQNEQKIERMESELRKVNSSPPK